MFVETSDFRLTKQVHLDFNATLKVEADKDGKIFEVIEIEDFEIEDLRSGIKIDANEDDDIELLHSSLENIEEDYFPGYSTCPDCGSKINFENDGGNGFCVKCAHNH